MAKSGSLNYGVPAKRDNLSPGESNKTSIINSFVKDSDVINMSERNVGKFHDQLQESINKREPIFIWSRNRRNEKIRLDVEYQSYMLQKISNLRLISDEYNRLQADDIFTEEFIRNLVANKRMEAEHFFEDAIAAHKVSLTDKKVKIDLTNSLIDHDQIEKDRKIAENERIRVQNEATRADNLIKYAEVDKIKAETDSITAQNELRRIVQNKIDFNKFPPAYLSDLLSALSGLSIKPYSEFDFDQKLKNIFERMENARASKAEEEVRDFRNSAEFRKWQFDQDKKNPKY
jgi:hypothetical protein